MTTLNVNGQVLPIKHFNLETLTYKSDKTFLNPRICIIAKSNSGKSWVIREIMKKMNELSLS
jgi:GTP-binding protein EngB required for normal cell division